MWTRVAVPLLLSALGASGVSVDIENGVYKLTESTLGTVLGKFPAVMVMFYSPESYNKDYDKAARKLKKSAPTEDGGARLAKVDAVAEPALKEKYSIKDLPTLLVFKGGELSETYTSSTDKEDLVAYMKAVATEPAPLGQLLQFYQLAYVAYKDLLRKVFPGNIRKHLFKAFPVMLALPLLLVFCCMCCCGSRKPKKEVTTKKGDAKRAKRSDSPAPKGKDDEGEATEEKKEEEKKED